MVKLSKLIHLNACLLIFASFLTTRAFCQNFQLHYDFRHSLDPAHNEGNFPSVYFEYFKAQDSGKAFIKPGSFFIKMQAD
ncbi:MAG TPA: hypothetical protein VFV08_03895, partial [Puia sp.]|nr:hypothetical protein [Puia sp.]